MKFRIKYLLISLFAAIIATSCELPSNRKHIILIISDGTHMEHLIAGSRYLTGGDNGLVFQKFPYMGFVSTWDVTCYNAYATINGVSPYDPANFDPIIGYDPSLGGAMPYPFSYLDSQQDYFVKAAGIKNYTDSASSATAMATGYKTVDGNINWLPGDLPDGSLKNITEELKEKLGYAIGVVSTVPFSHATPAAFSSHNVNRNNYLQIASEIISTTKPDVVIGGGHPAWLKTATNPGFTYISEADYNSIKSSSEYVFVERAEGINGAETLADASKNAVKNNKKLFGLFGGTGSGYFNGYFEYPVAHDNPGHPEFDIEPENPTLADTVKAAFRVLKQDPDGFFVMFEQGDADYANHAHDYNWMIGSMYDLNNAVQAAIDMVNLPGDNVDWSNTTLIVTADHANGFMRLSEENKLGKGDLPDADTFADYVTYGNTTNHTNEPVTLFVLGSGIHNFKKYEGKYYPGTRLIDNTDLNKVIKDIAGL